MFKNNVSVFGQQYLPYSDDKINIVSLTATSDKTPPECFIGRQNKLLSLGALW